MRRRRFTEEQITGVVKQLEAGAKIGNICRKHGISEQTAFCWKAKSGGMEISEAKQFKELEDENWRLKRVVADLTWDDQALKGVISRSW